MIGASTQIPTACLLSNGRYHTLLTNAGGGYSRQNETALTRWQEDFTRDNWGTFIYVRDLATKDFWSATLQPTLRSEVNYQACFSGAKATLDSSAFDVSTRTEITVIPDDDVELRRITITNHADKRREFDLTSYAEVVLDSPAVDDAHPAFSKLFVQTEIIEEAQAIVCHRRGEATQPWLFHSVLFDDADSVDSDRISYETDRARFIGRGCTTANPAAMSDCSPLTGSEGSVLDPIASVRCPIALDPAQSITVTYLFGAAENREACLQLLKKYRNRASIERGFQQSSQRFQSDLQTLKLTERDAELFDRLASSVIYGNNSLRADPDIIEKNKRDQSGLWGFSISGDLPIVLLEANSSSKLEVTRQLILAHAWWRAKGLAVDMVICNEEGAPADSSLQEAVEKLVVENNQADVLDKPGGVFVRLQSDLAEEDRILFKSVARIVLEDSGKSLREQMGTQTAVPGPVASNAQLAVQGVGKSAPSSANSTTKDQNLLFDNGLGGFSADGREYVISLAPGQTTPAPWVNVIANPGFGTLVSESGSANTWSENAQAFLLTPWSNDPVSDSSGEAFYLRDEETGHFWSPAPWPVRGTGTYGCRHGFGYSVFTHTQENIDSELWVYVAREAAIKFVVLKIINHSGQSRRLSATGYVEWVLGDQRAKTMAHVSTRIDSESRAVVASNPYSMDFGDRLAFFTVDDGIDSDAGQTVTGDRTGFLGRNGSAGNPVAMAQPELAGNTGAALDPCAAIRMPFDLKDGEQREIVFKLGAGRSENEIRTLMNSFKGADAAREELAAVTNYWNQSLGAIQIETPDTALNTIANGWLVYQIIASRLWGRTAFYQSSGAFGFRDQLQDVMALVHTEPGLVRAHIVLSASRQYPEGDVQHWWHPPVGRGVRTRCSDDYLWLVLATCRYVSVTGDASILDEQIHFLEGRPLEPDEESYYELPAESSNVASLYDHCVRAISHGLRYGIHGLPLMGTGDWNDGMNKVGAQGKGESIWLGFFLHEVIKQFMVLAHARSDAEFAALGEKEMTSLRLNLEKHGWDGGWFHRGYFDDGSVLGAARNDECQIDSIAQSWSVLSGVASEKRMHMAMNAVSEHLVQPEDSVIKLLAPPFDKGKPDPGYIQAYVPGVRENGGQYTHAAVWSVMAFAALADTERTWQLLAMLNPINHGSSPGSVALYKTEPYVLASDVYALEPHAGRGGWTWYSGSAGWMYRLIVESVLGLRRCADKLSIEPCIPRDWTSYKINYRFGETAYLIEVLQHSDTHASSRLLLDGVVQDSAFIALVDDKAEHRVEAHFVVEKK